MLYTIRKSTSKPHRPGRRNAADSHPCVNYPGGKRLVHRLCGTRKKFHLKPQSNRQCLVHDVEEWRLHPRSVIRKMAAMRTKNVLENIEAFLSVSVILRSENKWKPSWWQKMKERGWRQNGTTTKTTNKQTKNMLLWIPCCSGWCTTHRW